MTHQNFPDNSDLNLPQARTDMQARADTHARTSYDFIFSIFCVISMKGKGEGLTLDESFTKSFY